jgi:NADH:ubiquinone oxidoreductase subunit 5 (subunit L)/multisubunit Na+/H+ antiporter MnhA subunit
MAASILIATVGIGLGFLYYAPMEGFRRYNFSAKRTAERFSPVHDFLVHKWYFDELYDAALVRPTLWLARAVTQFDRYVIDGVVNGSSKLTVQLSKAEGFFDKIAVDGLVNLVAWVVYWIGDWGRAIQTGRLRNYLMFLSAAVVLLFFGVFAWIRG